MRDKLITSAAILLVLANSNSYSAEITTTLPFADNISDIKQAKIGGRLNQLANEYQRYLSQGKTPTAFRSSEKYMTISSGYVSIDIVSDGDTTALHDTLKKMGMINTSQFGRIISGRFPVSKLEQLNLVKGLKLARPAYAHKHSGLVTSQADIAMNADKARSSYNVDGTGVTIGTLSDSYNCLGGANAEVTSGDLPSGVIVLQELSDCTDAADEGRAMMELIHDVAPGAKLAFHTAYEGEADFAQGILDLANAGAKVINDDIIYFAEPMFQDGIIAQAVNQVKANGVAYFSSAGNAARHSYESSFRPSGQFVNIGGGNQEAHDFDPGTGVDVCQQITLPAGQSLLMIYQWDQPYFSVSGAPGSSSDMDIVLFDSTCTTPLAGSVENNIGSDPLEIFDFTNPPASGTTTFNLMILKYSGPNPGLMKTVNIGRGTPTEFDTQSSASFGHSAAAGGLGVGAAFYQQTPEFGVTPPLIEPFSSAGGVPILFTTAGTRLSSAEIRQQPDITAPDGTDNTFFGSRDPENNSFPNFFGTSAAAPHAAAVAALMFDIKPSLTPDTIYQTLKSTAIDMDDPFTNGFDSGFDFGTGHGLIQADKAIAALASTPQAMANLQINTSDSPDPVNAGSNITYTLSVTNHGPDTATAVTVTDPLPNGVNFVSASTGCSGTTTIICNLGNLANGSSATAQIVVKTSVAGTISNTATASSTTTDPQLANNSEGEITTVNAIATGSCAKVSEKCKSKKPTICGTSGNDVIVGTAGADIIVGLGGNDTIDGLNGNDLICGNSGDDTMNGGAGNDTLEGGNGKDIVDGGANTDKCSGETKKNCEG